MIITPDELLTLLAAISQKQPTPQNKDLTRAVNGMIVQARLIASNPALKARAAREMAGLEYAAKRLEEATRGMK